MYTDSLNPKPQTRLLTMQCDDIAHQYHVTRSGNNTRAVVSIHLLSALFQDGSAQSSEAAFFLKVTARGTDRHSENAREAKHRFRSEQLLA